MSALISTVTHLELGVVILAAGASVRMGQPKLLLPWGTTSVLGHLIQQWRELASAHLTVVCTGANSPLHAELDRLGVPASDRIVNPHPERGMFSSVQTAAKWSGWKGGLSHWALVLGDQPQIGRHTLQQLLAFALTRAGQVCQPSHHARPRHPVVLPKWVWQRLATARDDTLKGFLQSLPQPIALLEVDDPALEVDLDTPSDYAEALHLFPPILLERTLIQLEAHEHRADLLRPDGRIISSDHEAS